MNQHLAIRLTKAQMQRAFALIELAPGVELDEQLKLSTLEGETDLYEVVGQLLAEIENDEGNIAKLDQQVDDRAVRIERCKARIEARKNAIASLLDCAQETSLKLPEATVSLRTLKPSPKVMNEAELPDEFVTISTVRKPNREAIKQAIEDGKTIPGVVMTNGGSSLTVRRK